MKKSKGTFILIVVNIFFLLACISGVSAQSKNKPIDLNVAWFGPATHVVTTSAAEPWLSGIEKASDGKLKMNLYSGGTLVSAADTWQGINSGLADIGIGYVGYTPGRFSLTEVMSLPFLNIPDATTGSKITWRLYQENEQVQAQYPGVKMLFLYTNSPAQLHTTKKPVASVEDIKGMTVRCPGSIAPLFSAIGASPAVMGASEAYESLDRGVVDSTTFPWEALKSYKISEVTRFHTILNHYVGPYFVAMNLDSWKKLPAELQRVIEENCGEKAAVLFGGAYDKADSFGQDLIKGSEHKIITLSKSELQKFENNSQSVWNEWLKIQKDKGFDGQKVIDKVIELVKEYSN